MLEARIDRPTPPRAGEELDLEALARYLEETLGSAERLAVAQFPKGFSNLTYAVRTADHDLVLRRPPLGANVESAHDMGREVRILSALSPIYPKAPAPIAYCDDPAVLGSPFYLMERRRGVILRAGMPLTEHPSPEVMEDVAHAWVATLAELHAIDPHTAGLDQLGRAEGYIGRQIEGWSNRWLDARLEEVAALDRAALWLRDHQPPDGRAALIHNDFKYDNVVLDPEDLGRVVAVLDWEMATLGDPLMDLGTALGYWVDPDDSPALRGLGLSPTTLAGNPGRAAIAELYARTSGREPGELVFYYVYGLFKIAVIVQQIYARYRQGVTRDPRFAGLDQAVTALGEAALQAIARRRIDRLFT